MKVTQVQLEHLFDKMVCWLDGDKHEFRVGMRVSLKSNPRIWTVTAIYSTQDHETINRKWDVGGL